MVVSVCEDLKSPSLELQEYKTSNTQDEGKKANNKDFNSLLFLIRYLNLLEYALT